MIVKGKRDFTMVKHGKATIDVSEIFQDGEGAEVVVLEDCDNTASRNKVETTSKTQIILNVSDEAYPHLMFFLKHMEGIEIVEDRYIKTEETKCS
jgi:hypothetical protein